MLSTQVTTVSESPESPLSAACSPDIDVMTHMLLQETHSPQLRDLMQLNSHLSVGKLLGAG
jgi:hypothetical protein